MPQTISAATQATDLTKKTEASSRWRTLWLPALLCSLLLTIELHLLFNNLGGRPTRSTGAKTALATVKSLQNDVRHKFGETLIWDPPAQGQILYRADAIATMSGSQATVEFLDRSEILIEEGSLVIFEELPSEKIGTLGSAPIVARLVRGSIVRKKAGTQPLILKFSREPDAREHRFDDTKGDSVFRVVVQAHGIEVIVESGNLTIDGSRSLASGEKASFDTPNSAPRLPAPQLKKPKIEIRLPTPAHSRLEFWRNWTLIRAASAADAPAAPSDPRMISIHFEWETISEAKSYRIQISDDPSFSKPLAEKTVPGTSFEYETAPPQKTTDLYFRVAGIDANENLGEFSAVEKVEINTLAEAPKPPTPEPAPTQMSLAPETPPSPAPKATPLPRRTEIARAAPAPSPTTPAAPVVQATPQVVPAPSVVAPKTRARATTRSSFQIRADLAYGAVYQHRNLKSSDSTPKSASGGGLVPAMLRAEFAFGSAGEPAAVRLGGSYLFQTLKAESLSSSAASSAPDFRGWLLWGFSLAQDQIAAGALITSSQTVRWDTGSLSTKLKPLYGAQLSYFAQERIAHTIDWRLDLGMIAAGSTGADFQTAARIPIPFRQAVLWRQWDGPFLRASARLRVLSIESTYGGGLELGYLF